VNGEWGDFTQDSGTGIAFLFSTVPIGVRIPQKGEILDEIPGDLGFLQAEDVWLFGLQERFETFFEDGAEPVDVP
jgi:hypothetical protein